MRGMRLFVLTGCSAMMIFASFAARAGGGGTITFVGALVAPTCSFSAAQDLPDASTGSSGTQQSRQRSCSGAKSVSINASRTYNTSVVHLSNSENDQVLRYFASYVRAEQSGNADPVLVTQTYE